MRRRVRKLLFVAIGVLYVLSVPWYRETGGELSLLFGLPDWVAVALCCYVLIACLNAAAWLLVEMPDEAVPAAAEDSAR
jgi:hypothetical protein